MFFCCKDTPPIHPLANHCKVCNNLEIKRKSLLEKSRKEANHCKVCKDLQSSNTRFIFAGKAITMQDQIYKFNPEEVWFTSDTHFGHENIIRFCNRPFKNAEEMNAQLIRRWRETVPEDGIVFHLGDFAHGNARLWNDILSALPGRKFLILGNHDMKALRQGYMNRFELVTQQMRIRVGGQAIILNHNPFLCYGGSYRDVWQLFGHVHSGPASHTGLDHPRLRMLFPLQYDVGVDNNDFRPISFSEVKSKIEAQIAAAKAARKEL